MIMWAYTVWWRPSFASIILIYSTDDPFSVTSILALHRTPLTLILQAFPLRHSSCTFLCPTLILHSCRTMSFVDLSNNISSFFSRPSILLVIGTTYTVVTIFRSSIELLYLCPYSYPLLRLTWSTEIWQNKFFLDDAVFTLVLMHSLVSFDQILYKVRRDIR